MAPSQSLARSTSRCLTSSKRLYLKPRTWRTLGIDKRRKALNSTSYPVVLAIRKTRRSLYLTRCKTPWTRSKAVIRVTIRRIRMRLVGYRWAMSLKIELCPKSISSTQAPQIMMMYWSSYPRLRNGSWWPSPVIRWKNMVSVCSPYPRPLLVRKVNDWWHRLVTMNIKLVSTLRANWPTMVRLCFTTWKPRVYAS